MTKILCFSNPGEIDPRFIAVMGLNVKENQNPIGYFGTGLKYALAVTMRYGGKVKIQSGTKEITFSISKDTIRGKEFSFIKMHSDEITQTLGFTTELGKNWLPWMAYRELYCNTLDEKGVVTVIHQEPEPKAGFTRVLIQSDVLLNVHENQRNSFILSSQFPPLYANDFLEIYPGPSYAGFYHGIKVLDYTKPTVFTYNLLGKVGLTEDRTIDAYLFNYIVAREIWTKKQNRIPHKVLNPIINAPDKNAEHNFYFPTNFEPSPEILAAKTVSPAVQSAREPFMPKSALTYSRFDELKDNSPPWPSYTCSYINAVQDELSEIVKYIRQIFEKLDPKSNLAVDRYDYILNALLSLASSENSANPLEKLRADNENLRANAGYWFRICKDLTKNLNPISTPSPE